MIVKRNLSPRRVLQYTAGPMAWAALWAVTAPAAFALTDEARLILPFPVVATLGAALDIFVAFRNNSAFAALDAIWLTTPLSLLLAGTFIVLAVTGAANDEPFANAVTDVPIDAICTDVEHDLFTAIGHPNPPRHLEPVDGYLW